MIIGICIILWSKLLLFQLCIKLQMKQEENAITKAPLSLRESLLLKVKFNIALKMVAINELTIKFHELYIRITFMRSHLLRDNLRSYNHIRSDQKKWPALGAPLWLENWICYLGIWILDASNLQYAQWCDMSDSFNRQLNRSGVKELLFDRSIKPVSKNAALHVPLLLAGRDRPERSGRGEGSNEDPSDL